MGLFTVTPALFWEQTPYPRLACRALAIADRPIDRPTTAVAKGTGVRMGWSKEEKARRRAEAAGPHPRPRGRAPRGPHGRRKRWDKDNGCWRDDDVVLPMFAAPPLPSPAAQPQPQPSQPPPPPPAPQPPPPPKQQQRSETFNEQVLVTPGGSRGHMLKRTSPGGTTRCAQYTSPAGTVPQLQQCESRWEALKEVGWNEFGMNEPRKSARGFSWSRKWRY